MLYFENTAGWTTALVPLGGSPRLAGILLGPNGIDVLGWDSDTLDRFVVHGEAGTWQAPQVIGTSDLDIGLTALIGATLQNGTRPAALVMASSTDQLDFGDAGWSPLDLSRSYPLGTLGFDKNGKFYVLLFGGPVGTNSRFVEYLER